MNLKQIEFHPEEESTEQTGAQIKWQRFEYSTAQK